MKKIISFLIRVVPRKYLQLFSHILLKIVAIFYRGNKVNCPVCNHNFRAFLPYGIKARSNALCPNCLSLERHRMMWIFLKNETLFLKKRLKVLHIAPELCFINRFKKIHKDQYLTADIESPLAKIKLDVHDIPFEKESFDVIFCNHVMEHVRDDYQAMKEIHRVLKSDGFAILQIPLFYPILDVTYEDKSIITPAAREKAFGQSDHVRMYGKDYANRLKSVGFEVDENRYFENFLPSEIKYYGLALDEPIFYCTKK